MRGEILKEIYFENAYPLVTVCTGSDLFIVIYTNIHLVHMNFTVPSFHFSILSTVPNCDILSSMLF